MRCRLAALLLSIICLCSGTTLAEEPQLPIPIQFGEPAANENAVTGTQQPPVALPQPTSRQTTAVTPIESIVADSVPLVLPPRSATDPSTRSSQLRLPASWMRTASSLAVVLGVFFLLIWVVRRSRAPSDTGDQLFHTLGRVSLLGKQAHIVQFGDKLLLLAKTATGLEKLAELSRPDEVARITSLCHAGNSSTLTRSVSQVLAAQDRLD